MPWFRECVCSIPTLLQSPSVMVKVRAMQLARRVGLSGLTPETEEQCGGPALPLIVGHLDPRPQAGTQEPLQDLDYYNLRNPRKEDSGAVELATRTSVVAVLRGGGSSLAPIEQYRSRAELADAAGLALAAMISKPWLCEPLFRTDFFNIAALLVKEKLLPRGAVALLGLLFCYQDPLDHPLRLARAKLFLCAGHLEYLTECIEDGEPIMVETARQAIPGVTDFVVAYADHPEFPTEEALLAFLRAINGETAHKEEAYWAAWPLLEAGVIAMVTRVGGLAAFKKAEGIKWANMMISRAPMHAKVGAFKILSTALESGWRDQGRESRVFVSIAAIEATVDAALMPPSQPASQEAMRLLCVLTRGYPSACGSSNRVSHPRVPASAAHASSQCEDSAVVGSGDVGSMAGCAAPLPPAKLAQSASAGAGSAGKSSKRSTVFADADEGIVGVTASGDRGGSEAGSETPDTPADMTPDPPAVLAPDADLAPNPPADLAPHLPADLVPDKPADLAPGTPAELAPNTPADLAPDKSGDLASGVLAGLSNAMLAHMVRRGAAKAAIAHFKRTSARPARRANCGSSGLNRGAVVKFLSQICAAPGVPADLRESGGLELLVDLMRRGEGDEREHAGDAVAWLALAEGTASPPLWARGATAEAVAAPTVRAAGAIAPLVAQLEDLSGDNPIRIMIAIHYLIADTEDQPVPGAVDEVLAAGAVPVLLRIIASQRELAKYAVALLRLISRVSRGAAAIIAADYARPLVSAVDVSFDRRHLVSTGPPSVPDTRGSVVGMIIDTVEERPEQGEALFAAGLAAQLATVLSSPLDTVGHYFAMELVEDLSCHVPGACQALIAAGVFAEIQNLAVAAPASTEPRCAADMPGAEESHPHLCKIPEAVMEPEAVRASALLSRLADYCGGLLEIASVDAEPTQSTSAPETLSRECGTRRPETPEDVQEVPIARVKRPSRRVCSVCGVVSEKHLKVCSVCRRAGYCSRECQAAHWPVHKAECRRRRKKCTAKSSVS